MRIIHVAPFYSPVVGGVEEVVRRVAEHLAGRGHEVYVVTYNRLRRGRRGSLPREEEINGVKVVRLRPDVVWSHGTYSGELGDAVRRLRPDVVHVHVWRHPHVFQIARLKERLRFKAILHPHAPYHGIGQVGVITWAYYKFVDAFLKGALKAYDRVVALTPHEEAVLAKMGVGPGRVVVIPHGIDEDLLHKPSREDPDPVVFYLGRISRAKNIDLLIRAMEHVKAKLVLAGPDEGLAERLMRYARRKGIDATYMGYVSEEQKYELMGQAAVFAHPATYEPFGITLLEAQALGKPCVVTGQGGQLYAAPPGRTSLYAEPNPKSFAEAINKLLTDKALYRELSKNAREWAAQHTWSKILPMYEKLYEP